MFTCKVDNSSLLRQESFLGILLDAKTLRNAFISNLLNSPPVLPFFKEANATGSLQYTAEAAFCQIQEGKIEKEQREFHYLGKLVLTFSEISLRGIKEGTPEISGANLLTIV